MNVECMLIYCCSHSQFLFDFSPLFLNVNTLTGFVKIGWTETLDSKRCTLKDGESN